ncbi:Cerato-platanin-domain-containing protein [Cercophora newfieldiana]|uniref:Cerato-platanin-domain-containing protein n=1 Tax=Cercophora newfieldiana TaxID=92897 RepID=A0AA39YJW9_9PEZI|nr:Cerato-platanin-domain-containing protein [Cercophora newfieldiana]
MHLKLTLLTTALSLFTTSLAAPAPHGNPYTYVRFRQVTYDAGYDDANRTMEFVSCSNGRNGLMSRYGWQTQGEIPRFPYIGGTDMVEGWNSTNCGTCWSVTFEGRTVFILAIDRTRHGLNIARDAMDELTGGEAEKLGRVFAGIVRVPEHYCGL